jgi:hypothetical protein
MILIPLRTVPGLNAREHFRVRAKRVQIERKTTAGYLIGKPKPPIPCSVRLTRVSPRGTADDDNLVGAMKAIRDEVANWLGIDDKHRNQVRYFYEQKRGPWGVEIDFGEPVVGAQFELLGALA